MPLIYQIAYVLLALSAALTLVRALKGPTNFDRLAAVEALSLTVVGFLIIQSVAREGALFLDAALGLALFSFIGTVFLAYFLGEGELHE